MTAKGAKDAEEKAGAETRNANGEVSDEALLNAWVVGVTYDNPDDVTATKASKSAKG